MDKVLSQKAKDSGRANRDEDMDYFAVYYKEKCSKLSFSAFKKESGHPWKI